MSGNNFNDDNKISNSKDNEYVMLNCFKGIWTLDEVISLLHQYNMKVKVIVPEKGGDRKVSEMIRPTSIKKEVI